ncbi:hypothetical protein [Mucilaginibacter celer]|uniref:Uncharacterized protein n=1 Tax=Mucilaginibacter celer TaxID=2305508 RepID=A0A494VL60_9SPHI|nr:hypothetical protein [Mucilaginibacter celer]AYL94261.1 hypothetical protein HYN43_002660 [Mucilaginibacter celer]
MRPYYYFVENEGYVRVVADEQQRILPLVVLKTKLAQNFSAYGLIKKDLGVVKDTLTLLEAGVENKTIKQSLSFFAVVTYAKCYAQAAGRGVSLNIDAIKDLPKEVREEHDRLILQRNQYVAHGGGEGWEQNAIAVSLDLKNKIYQQIYPNIVFLIDIDSQLQNFRLLVTFVDEYVTNQLKKSFARLRDETAATDFEELAAAAFMPSPDELQRF